VKYDLTDEIADPEIPLRSVMPASARRLRGDDMTGFFDDGEIPLLQPAPPAVRYRARHLHEAEDISVLPEWLIDLADGLAPDARDELLKKWGDLIEAVGSLQALVALLRRQIAAGAAARGD
jgi:hypothetical protein